MKAQQEAELTVPLRRRENTDVETGVQDISFRLHIPVQTNLHLRAPSTVSIPSSPHTTAFILLAHSFQHQAYSIHVEHNSHTSLDHKYTSYSQSPMFMGTSLVRECYTSLRFWPLFEDVCIKRETLFVSVPFISGFKREVLSKLPLPPRLHISLFVIAVRQRCFCEMKLQS